MAGKKQPIDTMTGIDLEGQNGKPYVSATGVQNGQVKHKPGLVAKASTGDTPTGNGGRRDNRGYGE